MRYKAELKKGFKKSLCYFLNPDKNKHAILYEVGMTGYEIANKDYHLVRQGYYTYLLSLTLSGKAKISYNKRTYNLEKGDLVFINCNEPHEFIQDGEDLWEFIYIHITGLGVSYLYDEFINKTGNIFKSFPAKNFIKFVKRIHEKLDGLPHRKVDYTLHVEDWSTQAVEISENVYLLLCDIIKEIQKIKVEVPSFLKPAIDFIKQNYNRKISLDQIAEYACLSKFHFEREFAKHMGVTVYKYINELRFERARWLLESTDKKILEIALEVGFSDIQGLNKLFKDNTGKSPGQYRKEKSHY